MWAMVVTLGCTPDADDAFMLFGLSSGAVSLPNLTIELVEAPLVSLNDRASRGELDATMFSAAAYPLLQDHYALLASGASFGQGCGPVILSREPMQADDLAGKIIGIPGATTTAYAMLQLYNPTLRTRVLPFHSLLSALETGLVDCALVIHDEFVTYPQFGFEVVVNLGQWWAEAYDECPMPVTCCGVNRDLAPQVQKQVSQLVAESVRYARSHRAEAMAHAMTYAAQADPADIETFVDGYVNDLTENMGQPGIDALNQFFTQCAEAIFLPDAPPVTVIS
jgi:1,4-dihydroxy-6-naphthoate synthase